MSRGREGFAMSLTLRISRAFVLPTEAVGATSALHTQCGAGTVSILAQAVICRSWASPLRTTRAWPCSSRSSGMLARLHPPPPLRPATASMTREGAHLSNVNPAISSCPLRPSSALCSSGGVALPSARSRGAWLRSRGRTCRHAHACRPTFFSATSIAHVRRARRARPSLRCGPCARGGPLVEGPRGAVV